MLTKDLIRTQIDRGELKPTLLNGTPKQQQLLEDVIECFVAQIGNTRQQLDDALNPIAYRHRSLALGRGVIKVLRDACAFIDVSSCQEQRWNIFEVSAQALVDPAESPEQHRQRVAQELSSQATAPAVSDSEELMQQLYADLPHQAILEQVPSWSVKELLQRYNIALVQSILLSADSLIVTLPLSETGMARRVLTQLRFHRLVADTKQQQDRLIMQIAGPGSVLGQQQRYGMQLANFFTVLPTVPQWHLKASVKQERKSYDLVLQQCPQLVAQSKWYGFVPKEIASWYERLSVVKEWEVVDHPDLLQVPQEAELIAPDVALRFRGHYYAIECFHSWHQAPLQRRIKQLNKLPHLLIAVDKQLAKRKAIVSLLESEVFQQRGMIFSSLPTKTMLKQCLDKQIG